MGAGTVSGSLTALLVLLLLQSRAVAQTQPRFLNEILLGRCFENPPALDHSRIASLSCPSTVAGLVGVLESHLDSRITPEQFDGPYTDLVDSTSPPDAALFWLSGARPFSPPSFLPPAGRFVLPETTPGGALLADLVFCGIDLQHDDRCGANVSQAKLAFWTSVYRSFAAQASGEVRVVVDPDSDGLLDWFVGEIAPSLVRPEVTSVLLYNASHSERCSASSMTALRDTHNVRCDSNEDLAMWLVCNDRDTSSSSPLCSTLKTCTHRIVPRKKTAVGTDGPDNDQDDRGRAWIALVVIDLFIVAGVAFVFWSSFRIWQTGYEYIEEVEPQNNYLTVKQ